MKSVLECREFTGTDGDDASIPNSLGNYLATSMKSLRSLPNCFFFFLS